MHLKYKNIFLTITLFITLSSCKHHAGPVNRYYTKNGDKYRLSKIYGYPDGKRKLAQVDLWKNNWLVESKIYYELWPVGGWKFVSKNGFVTVKNGVHLLNNDSLNVPDNVLYHYYDKNYVEHIDVYKDRKRIEYTLGYPDGHQTMQALREKPGVYNWKDGKEYFEREFTEQEWEKIKQTNEILKQKTLIDTSQVK